MNLSHRRVSGSYREMSLDSRMNEFLRPTLERGVTLAGIGERHPTDGICASHLSLSGRSRFGLACQNSAICFVAMLGANLSNRVSP